MKIGRYAVPGRVVLAPMAGVTDRPFRRICRAFGASLAVSEMVTSDPRLRDSQKSRRRREHAGEPSPRSVQIVGSSPDTLADAARFNVDAGAEIIDINMGCPARKVCNAHAGSALLADETLVARILTAVVAAVAVPVTLKIRTGTAPAARNGVRIATIAEDCGVQALAVHGRTRACHFTGQAEYETIARICQAVRIPVMANGDITCPQKARQVLAQTGAAAVMIGRAAQGNPWLLARIEHYLATGVELPAPTAAETATVLLEHMSALYDLYGDVPGARIARKHVGWYLRQRTGGEALRQACNLAETPAEQLALVARYIEMHACLDRAA